MGGPGNEGCLAGMACFLLGRLDADAAAVVSEGAHASDVLPVAGHLSLIVPMVSAFQQHQDHVCTKSVGLMRS